MPHELQKRLGAFVRRSDDIFFIVGVADAHGALHKALRLARADAAVKHLDAGKGGVRLGKLQQNRVVRRFRDGDRVLHRGAVDHGIRKLREARFG